MDKDIHTNDQFHTADMNKHGDYVFGMDKDIQDRIKAKFNPEKRDQCQQWIEVSSCFTMLASPAPFHLSSLAPTVD
jgi:hypothetical protein